MIRILGRANSFNVRKVLWTCGELGLDFWREDWGRGYRPTTDPEFRAVNPIGLVPRAQIYETLSRRALSDARAQRTALTPPESYWAFLAFARSAT